MAGLDDLLAALERPIDFLVRLDWETYYGDDYTLSKMTTEAYIRDPRFEGIGVGIQVGEGAPVWTDVAGFRRWAAGVDWSRAACLAHHAHFDGLILAHHFGIIPAFWFCTLSMGRALHGVEVGKSLEKLARHYGVGEKGHEVLQAKGKRLRDFTPEEYAQYGRYCCNDVTLTDRLLWAMLPGFPELELWEIDKTIRMFTEPKFVTDQALLQETLDDERKRKADLLARVGQEKAVFSSSDKFAALLRTFDVEPPTKWSPKTEQEIYAFAKSDPGMQALLEDERDEVRWLAEARIAVKSTLNETRTERLLRSGSNGKRVPVYLNYHGAHTGRWSGGDGMNFQNFERTKKTDPKKGRIRRSLMAPPGRAVVVVDSGAIEARTNAWIAGHEELLEAFRQNRDVYSEFASSAYGRPIDRKKNPDDEVPGHVGKVCVLGLGYQMGALKLAAQLMQGAQGGPPVVFGDKEIDLLGINVNDFARQPPEDFIDSEDVGEDDVWAWRMWRRVEAMPSRLPLQARLNHCAVANAFVKRYRAQNAPIVHLWKFCERVLEAMVEGEEATFGPGECFQTARHLIRLPSGRALRYPGLEFKQSATGGRGHFSYIGGHGGKRVKVYGGLLTENIVQAVARDVVAEQMLWIATRYPDLASMAHDEVAFIVDEAEGPAARDFALGRMKIPPAWGVGLPLKAEGGFAARYGDAK